MKEQLLRYWSGLELRERYMAMLGGAVVALFLVYMIAVQPMIDYRHNLSSQLERKRATVAWMHGAAEQLSKQAGRTAIQNVDTGSLLTLVDTSARNAMLGNALKRVQQSGEAAVRVRFESASFDDLLLWLGNLQQQFGVNVSDITLERGEESGRVDASITLTRGN